MKPKQFPISIPVVRNNAQLNLQKRKIKRGIKHGAVTYTFNIVSVDDCKLLSKFLGEQTFLNLLNSYLDIHLFKFLKKANWDMDLFKEFVEYWKAQLPKNKSITSQIYKLLQEGKYAEAKQMLPARLERE